MAVKPSPSLTSTPALAPGAGTSLGSLACWSGCDCELVRVRVGQGATASWSGCDCELVRVRLRVGQGARVRVDHWGASWYWGGLTRKRLMLHSNPGYIFHETPTVCHCFS